MPEPTDHEIEAIDQVPYAPSGNGMWQATCSCSNSDGNGLGDVSFTAETLERVVNNWGDHLIETVERDIKESKTKEVQQ